MTFKTEFHSRYVRKWEGEGGFREAALSKYKFKKVEMKTQ